jgi:hypothetical protein
MSVKFVSSLFGLIESMDSALYTMAMLVLKLTDMVVEEEGGVKGCAGRCEMLFCWPFYVSRQMVKVMVPVWYLFLHRVIVITGKETQTGPFLHEKRVSMGTLWEKYSHQNTVYALGIKPI